MAIGGLGGKYISKFSPDCSKVGISRPDGCLAIYSGVVGGGCKLLHQFSPSTHLTALPTCLAWAGRQEGRKKKKRKSQENNGELNNSDLVAMGTTAGTVLVYSTMQGNMVTSFKTENNTRINSLVWTKSCNTIYAAGEVTTCHYHIVTILEKLCRMVPCPCSPYPSNLLSPPSHTAPSLYTPWHSIGRRTYWPWAPGVSMYGTYPIARSSTPSQAMPTL